MSGPGSNFHLVMQGNVGSSGHKWFPPEHIDVEACNAYIVSLKHLPKFLLTKEAYKVVADQPIEAVCKTIDDLAEMGMLRLPTPELILERVIPMPDGSERLAFIHYTEFDTIQQAHLVPEAYRKHPLAETGFIATAILEVEKKGVFKNAPIAKGHTFSLPPVSLTLIPSAAGKEVLLASSNLPWWRGLIDGHGIHDFLDKERDGEKFKQVVTRTLLNFIVLYHTRGISQERVDPAPPVKSRLSRLIKRKREEVEVPRYSHTVIDLAPGIKHLAGKTYRSGSGRASPRLHMRMGHAHTYHVGPGRKETIRKMVPSVMVGLSSRGEVTHDYRV